MGSLNVFLAFLSVAGMLFSILCIDPGKAFNFEKTNNSYYEIVYEESPCTQECILEYILFSNGLVYIKNETNAGGSIITSATIGSIDGAVSGKLVTEAEKVVGDSRSGGVDCGNCSLYHVFYGGDNKTRVVTGFSQNATAVVQELDGETRAAVKDLSVGDSFYIHFVFKRLNENIVDYHFFSDGIVLREEFGLRNGQLLSSVVYSLDPRSVQLLKDSVAEDFFASADDAGLGCVKKGLEWGYVELQKGAGYKVVNTCGGGDSGADKVFDVLFERAGGK